MECGGDVGEFTGRVRELFNLPEHVEIHLSFGCKEPGLSGQFLKLEGNSAFGAAVYCAALSAASRLETVKDTSVLHSITPAAGEGSSSSGGAGDSSTSTAGVTHAGLVKAGSTFPEIVGSTATQGNGGLLPCDILHG